MSQLSFRFACYFVFLQLIPSVSSVPFYSTLLPLAGVLLVTAVKDAYDDIVRIHITLLSIDKIALSGIYSIKMLCTHVTIQKWSENVQFQIVIISWKVVSLFTCACTSLPCGVCMCVDSSSTSQYMYVDFNYGLAVI